MASSQRTEDSAGVAGASGVPGTASTLPRPSSRPGGGAANKVTRMTENIVYQATRTVKKTRLLPGTIRKISLAILVDQDLTWVPDKTGFKRVLAPPSPEKLKTIRELVAGIAGLNTERGDQLVVETLPFESTLSIDPPEKAAPLTPSKPGPLTWPPNRNTLLIGGGAAIALIVLGFVAAMLLRKKPKVTASGDKALPAPADENAEYARQQGAIDEKLESRLAERDAAQQQMEAKALSALTMTPVITKTAEILAKHLREKIKAEPEVSAQVLRAWLHARED
jgi:flagellar M-ring protein FliF